MSLPRYPEYKDTGVEWIGKIPAHWDPAPLKRHVRLITDRATSRRRAIGLENVEGWSGRLIDTDGDFEGDGVAFEPGDVLFGKLRPYLAKVLAPDFPGEAVGDFHVLRPRGTLLPRYIQYQMLQSTFISVVDGSTFGSKMPRASWEALGGMLVMVPPSDEQAAIASFLDRETAKIDALIAEQEKLLALLAEKRQATISHAVTRGLDPNAPMKDSGIPWLGAVPAHWGVHSFRRELISSISNGIFKKKDEFGSGALLVNVFDIYRPDFQIEYGGLDRVMCSDAEIDSYRVHAGDLFFVRSSLKVEGIAVAAVAPSCDEPAVYECHLIRARPRANSFNARFASYLFNSDPWRQHFIRSAKITTMTTIDQEAILSTPVLLPPYAEQMEICEFVHSELKRLDATRHSVDGAIVLLRERRNALITAAVTGQIDVRGLAEARTA